MKDEADDLRLGMPATVYLPLGQTRRSGRAEIRTASDERQPAKRSGRASAETCCKKFRRETGEIVTALDDVSFEVRHGTLAALVGPDGAGKTTLIRLIAGLMLADSGTLTVMGIDVASDPQRVQDCIAYMPQRFGLYEDLSVQENLDLYASLHGISAEERNTRLPASFCR